MILACSRPRFIPWEKQPEFPSKKPDLEFENIPKISLTYDTSGYVKIVRDSIEAIKNMIEDFSEMLPIDINCAEPSYFMGEWQWKITHCDTQWKVISYKSSDYTYKWKIYKDTSVYCEILHDTSYNVGDFWFLSPELCWHWKYTDSLNVWNYDTLLQIEWKNIGCDTLWVEFWVNGRYRRVLNYNGCGEALVTMGAQRWIWVWWHSDGTGRYWVHDYPSQVDLWGTFP